MEEMRTQCSLFLTTDLNFNEVSLKISDRVMSTK